MILKKIISPNTLHKVRQLESLSKANLFANSCKPFQLGRTSTTLASVKHCLNSNVLSSGHNHLAKFPISAALGTQIIRNASTSSGDHVRMWVAEKVVSVALPIIIPIALLTENAIAEGIMSALIVIHAHWGLEAIIVDYARPNILGPVLPKLLHITLLILSAATLSGLMILINNGPGITRTIKNGWAIGKTPQASTK